MYIPQEKIDEIRESADILDFISGYIQLKKSGRNFFGLCPFHIEKTPSFSVNPEKQIFHCFGCGEGGNIYSFIMKMERVSFPEAVEFLADKLRIPIKKEKAKPGIKRENLYKINEKTAMWFHDNLVSEKIGEDARKYLKNRGIFGEIIDKFTIGYAPDMWDGLIKHFGSTGNNELLERAGLVIKSEKGEGYYDRFRNRIIFPIRNEFGKIVGFGGRKLNEDDPGGKYINSPETEIYNKSKILYGLFEAKDKIREKKSALIVEGYIDLISLYMEGYTNIVAPLGTSLTGEQAKSLSRFTDKVIMIFDADEAGLKATLRAAEILIENNIDMEIAVMTKGEDPDSFIKKYGAEQFDNLLGKRIVLIDFLVNLYRSRYNSPIEKISFLNEILAFFSNITDNIKRGYLINKLSVPMEMNPVELQQKTIKLIQRKKINREKQIERKYDEDEDLLRLFFTDENARDLTLNELELNMLENERIRKMFELLFNSFSEGNVMDVAGLMDIIEEESLKKYLSKIILKHFYISKEVDERMPGKSPEKIVYKIILGRKKEMLQKEIDKVRIKWKVDENNKDIFENYKNLINKKLEIEKELDEII